MNFSKSLPIVAVMLLAATAACSEDNSVINEGPETPAEKPLDPESVLLSASGHFSNRWCQPGETIEVGASIKVTSPAGATVDNVIVMVDGKETARYAYPMPDDASFIVRDFAHGSHELQLMAEVSYGDETVAAPVFAPWHFIVFDSKPRYTTAATVDVAVSGKSSTGETYQRDMQLQTTPDGRIPFPKEAFAWTPASGTASTLDVSLSFEPRVVDATEGLEFDIREKKWNLPKNESRGGDAVSVKWSNPVRLDDYHGLTPSFMLYIKGTHEGIELNDSSICGFISVMQ